MDKDPMVIPNWAIGLIFVSGNDWLDFVLMFWGTSKQEKVASETLILSERISVWRQIACIVSVHKFRGIVIVCSNHQIIFYKWNSDDVTQLRLYELIFFVFTCYLHLLKTIIWYLIVCILIFLVEYQLSFLIPFLLLIAVLCMSTLWPIIFLYDGWLRVPSNCF